ncbi:MAG: hypothetical protein JNG89_10820 [Planctomycetaceae bacterium]|nr:hypothetical protein [Planctomycetaceae bacterium]
MRTILESRSRWAVLALALLMGAGCEKAPSRWESAQTQTEGKQTSVAQKAVDGGTFNQFFPKQGDGYDIVFKQEKSGFAQASLQQGGKELALFSIFDTESNPDARTKFEGVTDKIAGYPIVTEEAKSLSALVGQRFQVQVRSVDAGFGESDRKAWLEKFDLTGVAELE